MKGMLEFWHDLEKPQPPLENSGVTRTFNMGVKGGNSADLHLIYQIIIYGRRRISILI